MLLNNCIGIIIVVAAIVVVVVVVIVSIDLTCHQLLTHMSYVNGKNKRLISGKWDEEKWGKKDSRDIWEQEKETGIVVFLA